MKITNWGPLFKCSVYSGTVAGAREAFFNGVPSVSISYDWYVFKVMDSLEVCFRVKIKYGNSFSLLLQLMGSLRFSPLLL